MNYVALLKILLCDCVCVVVGGVKKKEGGRFKRAAHKCHIPLMLVENGNSV